MLFCLVLTGASIFAQDRVFTVRDSIEMARFDRDNPTIEFSPDNRFFAVVTSRGILHSNTVESTIWVFSAGDVRAFLQGNHAGIPQPRMAARLRAVISSQRFFPDSYEPVILNVRWLPGSQGMLFLAEGGSGERRLYRADLASGKVQSLTPAGYDVTQFAMARDAIIYEATPPTIPTSVGEPINADAVDVTGVSMSSLLFPHAYSEGAVYSNLWSIRNDTITAIVGEDATRRLEFLNSLNNDVFSVAPDGKNIVVLLPVENVPPSWADFEPPSTLAYMRIKPQDPETTARSNGERPVEYAVVDLTTGKTTRLLHAPNAWTLGADNQNSAAWAPSGMKIVLTNTFLPLDGVNAAERAKRRYPCIAAVVDVLSKDVHCLNFDTYDYTTGIKGSRILQSAAFTKGDDTIVLHMQELPSFTPVDEYYHNEHGNWSRVASVNGAQTPTTPVSIAIQQDIQTPPALWATDSQTHVTRKLWDPNPQLAKMNLGTASIFHWKDASGHAWSAGLIKPPHYIPGKRYPLVIQTHGFDPNEFLTDGSFTTAFAARPLASAGIVVLQMTTNHAHLVSSQEAPDQLRGFESAIAQLDAAGLIDPKRVGIIGFSRTCYYVESALIEYPKLFAAASITDGVDQSYMQYLLFGESNEDLRNEGDAIYGTPPFGDGLPAWTKAAPGFNLYRVQAPLLIASIGPGSILGEWEIYASLRMQKKPVDLMYIPDGQHILQKPLERLASQQSNVDWFRFWLQGYEDPNPLKKAQYTRWRSLRALQKP